MYKTIISAILLFGTTVSVALASSASKADKPAIPADLYYEFKAVPVDENAIINWRRAAQVQVPLGKKAKEAIKYCWTPGARQPSATDEDELQTWLRRNKEALELFDTSRHKPKAQWPEMNPKDFPPEISAVSQLTKARLLQVDQFAEKHEFEKAAQSLQGSLQLTQCGIEGNGAFIHYLISASARTLVQGGILRLASRREAPLSILEKLLTNLPKLDAETNIYCHVLRVEFSVYGYASIDLHEMAEAWSKISETNVAMTLYPEEMRRPFKVLLDPSLVSQHPKPFDTKLAIEQTVWQYRNYRTNCISIWTNRSDAVEEERIEAQKKLLEDIKPLMQLVQNEPFPLSKQAAQKARNAYLQIDNPVGRLFECSNSGLIESDSRVFRSRTEREAIRAVLAIQIYQRRKSHLPGSLSDLVKEKILDSIPYDPFADAPLSYSRERRLVWSVGEDGVDDGGEGDRKARWFGEDAVWEITEMK